MCSARAGASAAMINGILYVVGGRSTSSNEYTAPVTLNSVECFDPVTDSWFELGHTTIGRCEAALVIL